MRGEAVTKAAVTKAAVTKAAVTKAAVTKAPGDCPALFVGWGQTRRLVDEGVNALAEGRSAKPPPAWRKISYNLFLVPRRRDLGVRAPQRGRSRPRFSILGFLRWVGSRGSKLLRCMPAALLRMGRRRLMSACADKDQTKRKQRLYSNSSSMSCLVRDLKKLVSVEMSWLTNALLRSCKSSIFSSTVSRVISL